MIEFLRRRVARVRERVAPAVGSLRRALAPVTATGWTVLMIGLLAWGFGVWLGWMELLTMAAGCLAVVGVSVLWTLRPPPLRVRSDLVEDRVVVGARAVGRVMAHNPTGRRLGSVDLEIPVGKGAAFFSTDPIGAGETWRESFVIPTERRSVIRVGPSKAVAGDPLGLIRRAVTNDDSSLLYVHPLTIRLPTVSSGWFRDLEGQETTDLSPSDVAFHTLREYVPGDDRRHVHWRTSARLGTLMVKQFVDTRRSHLGVCLSTRTGDWADEDEFEFGVQVAGSLGRTGLAEGQAVTPVVGSHVLLSATPTQLLDGLAGVDIEAEAPDVGALIRSAVTAMRAVSTAMIVVGSGVALQELRRHIERFPPHVRVSAVICHRDDRPTLGRTGRLRVVQVGDLQSLPAALQAGVTA